MELPLFRFGDGSAAHPCPMSMSITSRDPSDGCSTGGPWSQAHVKAASPAAKASFLRLEMGRGSNCEGLSRGGAIRRGPVHPSPRAPRLRQSRRVQSEQRDRQRRQRRRRRRRRHQKPQPADQDDGRQERMRCAHQLQACVKRQASPVPVATWALTLKT